MTSLWSWAGTQGGVITHPQFPPPLSPPPPTPPLCTDMTWSPVSMCARPVIVKNGVLFARGFVLFLPQLLPSACEFVQCGDAVPIPVCHDKVFLTWHWHCVSQWVLRPSLLMLFIIFESSARWVLAHCKLCQLFSQIDMLELSWGPFSQGEYLEGEQGL